MDKWHIEIPKPRLPSLWPFRKKKEPDTAEQEILVFTQGLLETLQEENRIKLRESLKRLAQRRYRKINSKEGEEDEQMGGATKYREGTD